MSRPPIVMVGAFPPPVHGMAAVNAAVRETLRQTGVKPNVIDVAAPGLDRSILLRLGRLPKVVHGLALLAGKRKLRGSSLYMSVSGGLGQVYECAFICLARLRRMRVFLHHHSFAYLDNPKTITRVLTRIAGPSAFHVVLSPCMAERLTRIYGAKRVIPVSNTVFRMQGSTPCGKPRQHLRTLGFISNISAEKGVFDFLDLLAAVQAETLPLQAKLAGPFQDAETERQVMTRLAAIPNVEYVGPKYGAEKDAFFSSIDVLVFPTRYVNEAEPLTVYEAMSRGIPVVAYGRGCIPEILTPECGKVIDPAEPFVPLALKQIRVWLDDPGSFKAASIAAVRRFEETYAQNKRRWQMLLADLIGSGADNGAKYQTMQQAGVKTE